MIWMYDCLTIHPLKNIQVFFQFLASTKKKGGYNKPFYFYVNICFHFSGISAQEWDYWTNMVSTYSGLLKNSHKQHMNSPVSPHFYQNLVLSFFFFFFVGHFGRYRRISHCGLNLNFPSGWFWTYFCVLICY